ncbi:MAG: helix-turn-helix transcriptional regulator [Bacteroidales bacterium]|nr:helix-turn-helix transcriptional regulator [Bacteroidales bacterium]
MTINEAVMARLGEMVDESKLTSPKHAEEAGLPGYTVRNIKKQKTKSITLKSLYELCGGLGIPVTEFLDSGHFDRKNLDGFYEVETPGKDPPDPEVKDRTVADAVTTRIEWLVREKKMTKKEVAARGHISESAMTNMRKGNTKGMTLTTLLAICDGLGITMGEFLDCEYLRPEHLTDL